MSKYLGLYILLLLFSNSSSKGQEIKNIDTVYISAQRIKQSVSRIPFSINTYHINKAEKLGSRTLPESFNNSSGVFVQKTSHAGGSAFIRGLTGNQTLLIVDGIRLNNSTFRYGPNQYLNTIDLYSIDKIEVLKGTGSVQYGSDALSGVIQVFSKESEFTNGEKKFKSSINFKNVSKNMEKTFYTNFNYSSKNTSTNFGLSVKNFGDLIGGDTTGKQSPSGYKEYSYNINSSFKTSDNTVLSVGSRLMIQKDIPYYYKYELENYKLNNTNLQLYSLNYIKYKINTKNKYIKNINSTLSYQNSKEDKEIQKNNSDIHTYDNNDVNTLGCSTDILSEVNKYWKFNSGIEFYKDKISSRKSNKSDITNIVKEQRGLYPNNSTFISTSIFSLHQFAINKFNIQAGIRYNTFNISLSDTSVGNVNYKPNAIVYNFGILYQFNKENAIYTNLSTGYRTPNIDDLGTLGIVDFRYEIPSLKLKPEKSINTEIGYRFIKTKFQFEAAAFYIRLNDIITRTKVSGQKINGYDLYVKNNDQTAFIRGYELSTNYLINNNVSISSNLSYTYGKNITLNEALRRIPPLHGLSKITYEKNNYYITAVCQYASKQTRLSSGDKSDNRINKNGTEDWTIFDINTGYKFKNIELSTGIQNILNKDYRTHGSGLNGVGRSLWFNVKVLI